MTDEGIVGLRKSFTAYWDRLSPGLLKKSQFELGGRREEAQDIVQSVGTKLWSAWRSKSLLKEGSVDRYVWKMVSNEIANYWRERQYRHEKHERLRSWRAPSGEPDPAEAVASKAGAVSLLECLNDRERLFVTLALEGYDYRTISEIIGVSEGTVKSTISRSRQKVALAFQSRAAEEASRKQNFVRLVEKVEIECSDSGRGVTGNVSSSGMEVAE